MVPQVRCTHLQWCINIDNGGSIPPLLPFSLSLSSSLREHASRSTKGMQLLILPLYGGLPYTEQVCSWPWTATLSPGSHGVVPACDPGNEAGTDFIPHSHLRFSWRCFTGLHQTQERWGVLLPACSVLVLMFVCLFVLFVCLVIVCCLLFAQVVVATNIAETSVTINGIVYGVCTSHPVNHFFTIYSSFSYFFSFPLLFLWPSFLLSSLNLFHFLPFLV